MTGHTRTSGKKEEQTKYNPNIIYILWWVLWYFHISFQFPNQSRQSDSYAAHVSLIAHECHNLTQANSSILHVWHAIIIPEHGKDKDFIIICLWQHNEVCVSTLGNCKLVTVRLFHHVSTGFMENWQRWQRLCWGRSLRVWASLCLKKIKIN